MIKNYRIERYLITCMRTSFIILTIIASMAQLLLATSGNAQRLTIELNEVAIKVAFQTIEQKTGVSFVYDPTLINGQKRIKVIAKNESLAQVLAQIGDQTDLAFRRDGNYIAVSKKKPKQMPEIPKPSKPQQDTILNVAGIVTDSLGNPLIGVSIRINGTNRSVATNERGQFTLNQIPVEASVLFSFIGYDSQTISAKNLKSTIILSPTNATLTEVEVNAGYWKVNEKLRTGNISKVSGETIQKQPVSDPMLGLAGRVPGLQISQNSGLPGAFHSIRIRGTNSIANGNNPMFIIDGVPFSANTQTNSNIGGGATQLSPFALINAHEIESIEVLKDADATAIYGSRGANGVILITTKKGQIGQTQLNVNAYSGAGRVTNMVEMLNTAQYLEMRREAFKNDGISTYAAWDYDVNGAWDTTRYTDWQKVFIGNTARISNIQAQVSGGTGQTRFTAGGGFLTESTVVPGDYRNSKGSGNININHRSKDDKIGVNMSARYLNDSNNQPKEDFSTNYIVLPPNAPALYDATGNLNWENNTWDNPFAQLNARATAISKNLIANANLDYKITKGLQAVLNVGYNETSMRQSIITPSTAYNPTNWGRSALRSHFYATNRINTWIIEPQLNLQRKIAGGTLEATIGSTFQETYRHVLAQLANDFTDDALLENLSAGSILRIPQNQETQYRYGALFGRIHYNWQDKYLLNLVARRDGSSRFAPETRYGNFASIGTAWLFSKESIFKETPLSHGKLRVSYGVTGNDQLTDYAYLSTYSSYSYQYLGITGLFPTRLYSPDFGWEAVHKAEAGLDLGFLNDRFTFGASYYRNRTKNQLVGYALPTVTGFASIQANLPAIIQNSGWELELNTSLTQKTLIKWNVAINLSVPRNKLVAYPDLEASSYRNRYEVGKPLSIQKRWHWTGVNPETGIHSFEDVNADGRISSPQDLQALINTGRQYFGGILNSLKAKGFQLDIFIQFEKGLGNFSQLPPGIMRNQPTWVLDRWQEPNDITNIQRFTQSGIAMTTMLNGRTNADFIYQDASFIRFKNVSLSYSLPSRWLNPVRISQFSVYIQAQNLLTFTKYNWLDPETLNSIPPVRMVTAGLNITI